jgi:ABC-type nitrate/sulfonate/bicarbonate transport system substrate-binding protein
MVMTKHLSLRAAAAALATMFALSTPAAADATMKAIVFPGMQNLPLFAAQAKGFFAKRGLTVELVNTPSSDELRNGLAEGRYQIAHGGVDNAVAMAEVAKKDIAVLLGGDNAWMHFFAQPDIASFNDLRGKTVIVDAPNTAYAFQLYEIMKLKGLKKSDYQVKVVGATFKRLDAMKQNKNYAATMLNPPFSILAEKAGMKDFGLATSMLGPYQGSAGWVMRDWAKANSDTLIKYLQAYVEGVRWTLDPKNKAEAVKLLMERLKLPQDVAEKCVAIAIDPKEGLAKDAKLDMVGFKNVLRLRAEWQGGTPADPQKYVDQSYYQKALAGL